jgi:predicted lipoprotein
MLTLMFSSCSKKTTVDDDLITTYDRENLLSNLSGNYIVPAYANFSESVSSLETASLTFLGDANENNLNKYKSAWENCLFAWQDVSFLEFGPAGDVVLRAQTNVYPVDAALIDQNIQNGGYNLATVNNFSAKGIQALDYLLFSKSNPQEAVAFLSGKQVSDYVADVIKDLKTNTKYVVDNWSTYSGAFIANSESNADGSSMSTLVNELTKHYEAYIRRGKLGIPAGVFNGFSKQPMPGHVEALHAKKSLAALSRAMESMEKYFNGISYVNGSNGEGLDDYLDFTDARKDGELLSKVIQNQLSSIKDAINVLNVPLSNEVEVNNALANKSYQELQKLVALLKVDMMSAFGILVNYQDSDGD